MTQPASQEAFRFFDLPLELRNRIYDHITKKVRVYDQVLPDVDYIAWISNLPSLPLLLTNHQLSTEYRKQRHRNSKSQPITLTLVHPASSIRPDFLSPVSDYDWPQNFPAECARMVRKLVVYGCLECLELYPPKPHLRPARRFDRQNVQNIRDELEEFCDTMRGPVVGQFWNLERIEMRLFVEKPPMGWPERMTDAELEEYFGLFEVEKPWEVDCRTGRVEVGLLEREEDFEGWWKGEVELEGFGTWTKDEGWKSACG